MSLIIAKCLKTQAAHLHDGMYEGNKWREEFVKRVIEYMENLYVRDCANWCYAVPSLQSFFIKLQPLLTHVPLSLIKITWDGFPTYPGLEMPFKLPGLHVTYHGYLTDFTPKISFMSSPNAIANFNGCDLPSLTYEDPSLWTVPTFTITHDMFVYITYNCHILYCSGNPFRDLIPPLQVWHKYLESHYQGLWREGITDVKCILLFFREHQKGGHLFDLQLLEFVNQFKTWGNLDKHHTGYDHSRKHLWWLDSTSRKRFTYWPGTDEIMADFKHAMACDTGSAFSQPRCRGLYATALARPHAAAETHHKLPPSQYNGHTVCIQRPVPRVS
ncbi:hypothetical protein BKA82DRAFT_35524 [Pisolithus tinctorius]|uniref:Uncharacterized protein n=1 Tax=Pisolithus tinctorius Marx 270 TaxID=870435 RepID=A0A0C3NDX5_PISTI|nr:hypothetical protein BKA82DRAFT_35524 [Pisolithus tinctorius]KIN93980.1 hypothetical protein M404DRAFT_35524 [Pisolithus tinctorius Marx 270]